VRIILWAIFLLYAVTSVIAFCAMALDKHAATRGRRRIRENTLHQLELLGGWPGSLVAQRWLRHKTADRRYRFVFRLIIAAHVLVWVSIAAIVLWPSRG
jgi:uncharacterized membrane protein YsdA (DUF1294 family)